MKKPSIAIVGRLIKLLGCKENLPSDTTGVVVDVLENGDIKVHWDNDVNTTLNWSNGDRWILMPI